jgi:hypothetical protein
MRCTRHGTARHDFTEEDRRTRRRPKIRVYSPDHNKMSESKQSPQSPKMKAVATPPQEGGSNGEFVVHTKHTCDMCFRRPIIGQRYASVVQPNFDLCARCLEAYSGPDIGLTEAVLSKSNLWQHRHFMRCFPMDN